MKLRIGCRSGEEEEGSEGGMRGRRWRDEEGRIKVDGEGRGGEGKGDKGCDWGFVEGRKEGTKGRAWWRSWDEGRLGDEGREGYRGCE